MSSALTCVHHLQVGHSRPQLPLTAAGLRGGVQSESCRASLEGKPHVQMQVLRVMNHIRVQIDDNMKIPGLRRKLLRVVYQYGFQVCLYMIFSASRMCMIFILPTAPSA
jgi:hypothetical protein